MSCCRWGRRARSRSGRRPRLPAYRGRPGATAETLQDGWLLTGDSGQLDDADCLSYLGRRKELPKVNGMSVFRPSSSSYSGATGGSPLRSTRRPGPTTGERTVAFVLLAPDTTDTTEDVVAWCRANMAPYKIPGVRLVGALPVTATGKVIKRELAERLDLPD